MNELPVPIQKLHEDSCTQKLLYYTDPGTGRRVFTKLFHLDRGFCCGSGCRHCPFDHKNVPAGAMPYDPR